MNLPILNDLIKQDPAIIFEWVNNTLLKPYSAIMNFNWHLLAEIAASHSRIKNLSKQDQLLWARISIVVYHFLDENDNSSFRSFESSEMHLRASTILRHENVAGDPILDVNIIKEWFVSRLPFELKECSVHIAKWEQFVRKEPKRSTVNYAMTLLMPLRSLKSRISVIELLTKSGIITEKPFTSWVTIKRKLP